MKHFFTFFVYLTVVLAITLILLAHFKRPHFLNWSLLSVTSGSMSPAIPTGSLLAVKAEQEYEVGEVIAFLDSLPSLVVTHRIDQKKLQNNTAHYLTKGDANAAADLKWVDQNQVLGKVRYQVPYIGHLVNFIRLPLGAVCFIVVPATILIYEELKDLFTNLKEYLAHFSQQSKHV